MKNARLQLFGLTGKYATINLDATEGATVGVNLYRPDGTVLQMSDLGGRSSGYSGPSVTDELDEGAYNLYFTNKRAQDAVGAILVDTSTIDFNYDPATPSIKADLKELSNAGGGALVKISRDSYGRVSGTSSATTDDLAEGATNQYFTRPRVADSLIQGSGISLTLDINGRTTISYAGSAPGGNVLTDWAGVELTDWAGNTLTDWAVIPDEVTSFNNRTGAVMPVAGDYTTDQIAEASALYFTELRVRNAVLLGLASGASIPIAAADSLLIALAKLQAQITARQVIGDPVAMPEYTLTTLPSASSNKGKSAVCTNLTEGYRPVWSDGTNWRRFTDNTVAN